MSLRAIDQVLDQYSAAGYAQRVARHVELSNSTARTSSIHAPYRYVSNTDVVYTDDAFVSEP